RICGKMSDSREANAAKRAARREVKLFQDAIRENDIEKVKTLIHPRLDLNFSYKGISALEIAVKNANEEMCKVLLNNGADTNKEVASHNSLLNLACWGGYTAIAKLLMDNNADLDAQNENGSTCLNTAVSKGNNEIAKMLIAAGAGVDMDNNDFQSPLSSCARLNNAEIAACLTDAGCELNHTEANKMTPLIVSATNNHEGVVDILIKAGCDLELKDRHFSTALWYAASEGHIGIVKTLLLAGANINAHNAKKVTPLLESVRKQHFDIAKLLVQSGADLNKPDSQKCTPLHEVVRIATKYFGKSEENVKLMKLLIESGSEVNLGDRDGATPLYQTASAGNKDMTDYLLSKGALPTAVTNLGETMLHGAVLGHKLDVLNTFLDLGVDVNQVNKRNELPIYTAVLMRAKIDMIERLISAGSELDYQDNQYGHTPLHMAVEHNLLEVVKLLLKAGCDPNLSTLDGKTPLYMACENGKFEVIQALTEHPGIDLDRGLKHVPLHKAVLNDELTVVEAFLEAGCDIDKANHEGKTALYFAAERKKISIVKLLLKWGACPTAPQGPPGIFTKCCQLYTDAHPHLELEPLFAAVQHDDAKLMKYLIMSQHSLPFKTLQTIQDIIFRMGYARDANLTHKATMMFSILFKQVLNVWPLHALCRGAIRKQIGQRPHDKVANLSLPRELKDLVLMKSLFD
ncbi:unnamed protein product, partial [Owenia fusiformis]